MEINVGKLNELPEGSYQLIDMRSDRDFEYGTIPGAIHISQEDLQGNPQIIKSKKVILFCAHGTNSIEAAEELEAEGYRAYSLEGGYIASVSYTHLTHPQKISQNHLVPVYQSSKTV